MFRSRCFHGFSSNETLLTKESLQLRSVCTRRQWYRLFMLSAQLLKWVACLPMLLFKHDDKKWQKTHRCLQMRTFHCIPVGCVPPTRWPYLPACSALVGVCSRGRCLVPGSGIPACTEADPPPLDRILNTRFWKYYLAPTSLRAVKTHRCFQVQMDP